MASMRPVPLQALRKFLLVVVAVALGGCTISVERPANNARVTLPTATRVVVTGNASFTALRVSIDGTDVSPLMSFTGSSRAQGDFMLPPGLHTVRASARVRCWYCGGGTAQTSDMTDFVVVSGPTGAVCARGGPPIIAVDPNLATAGQQPGRQRIGYFLQNGDYVEIFVDDAPGLLRTQMLVEVDMDPAPFGGVTKSKRIDAWRFCQAGSPLNAVTVGLAGALALGLSVPRFHRRTISARDAPHRTRPC
jgi:hypothetical protein